MECCGVLKHDHGLVTSLQNANDAPKPRTYMDSISRNPDATIHFLPFSIRLLLLEKAQSLSIIAKC